MEMDKDIVKLYFVNDPNGNYFFWLNNLQLKETKSLVSRDFLLEQQKSKKKMLFIK